MRKTRWLALACGLLLCAAQGIAQAPPPEPTPKPLPLDANDVPLWHYADKGVPARTWAALFLRYLEQAGLPVEAGGFQKASEDPADGRIYRLMAGGAKLYIQVCDGLVVRFSLALDDEAMTTADMEARLLRDFPLVMNACVYASEQGASVDTLVVDTLCPDLSKAYKARLVQDSRVSWHGLSYQLIMRSQGHWHTVDFRGEWGELE